MERILKKKFKNVNLRSKLISCDIDIIEHNYWHDNYYGDCTCKKCNSITGQNHLGKILMKIRRDLIKRKV
jgi:predicted NAD-dependent protein-ADP-ribosyltransferase YbiA (DUF1768 family)